LQDASLAVMAASFPMVAAVAGIDSAAIAKAAQTVVKVGFIVFC
jgi:hypothetical protein